MIWAGTSEGLIGLQRMFEANAELLAQIRAGTYQRAQNSANHDDDDELDSWGDAPEEIQISGSVGIVSWSGAMARHETWLTRLFGVPTYAGIKNATTELVNNGSVQKILMNADTPGGVVDGCAPLGEWLSNIDSKVKPIYGFTGGELCSAGYWLFSGLRRIYADSNSSIGSVGVIAVHTEKTKQLQMLGVTVSVFRSAPYKALANGFEKLSELGAEQINAEIAAQHNNFEVQISNGRKLPQSYVHTNIATGKVFDEKTALNFKMIDAIASIEVVVGKLSEDSNKGRTVGSNPHANRAEANNMAKKKTAVRLPPETLALMALGATVPVNAQTTVEVEEEEEEDTDAASAATATATATAVGTAATTAAATAAATDAATASAVAATAATAAPAAPAAATANDAVVALLTSQLQTAQTDANGLREKLTAAENRATTAAAAVTAMEPALRVNIQRMAIALGVVVVGLDGMTGATLAQQFDALNTQFEARYPSSRKTTAAAAAPVAVQTATVTPASKAQLRATGLPNAR